MWAFIFSQFSDPMKPEQPSAAHFCMQTDNSRLVLSWLMLTTLTLFSNREKAEKANEEPFTKSDSGSFS